MVSMTAHCTHIKSLKYPKCYLRTPVDLPPVEESDKKIKNKKNFKNVKRCRDGMPKSMQTKYIYIGMMHERKGQRIGKAPSLHLFHTTVRQHP